MATVINQLFLSPCAFFSSPFWKNILFGQNPRFLEEEFTQTSLIKLLVVLTVVIIIFIAYWRSRKRNEARLQRANLYYRALIESNLDPMLMIDLDGITRDVNRATEELTGCSREELIGATFSKFSVDIEQARLGFGKVLQEGSLQDYGLEIRHKDGTVRSLQYNAVIFRDETGKEQGVFATARDITSHKKALLALQDSEKKFRAIIEQFVEGFALVDQEGTIIEWNHAMEEISGIRRDEAVGTKFWDLQNLFLPPQHRTPERYAFIKAGMMEALRTGNWSMFNTPINAALQQSDGKFKFIQHMVFGIQTGEEKWVGYIAQDVTARKQDENTLRENESRLRSYFSLPIAGVFVASPEFGWLDVNDCMCSLLGYSREELLQKSWKELSLPVNLEAEDQYYERILSGKINGLYFDKQMVRKDGTTLWTTISIQVERFPDGKVKNVVGFMLDISERKRVEEELFLESAERFKAAQRSDLLVQIASHINASLELNQTMNTVCEEVSRALHAPVVIFRSFDEDTDCFLYETSVGVNEPLSSKILPVNRTLVEKIFKNMGKNLYTIPDVEGLKNYSETTFYEEIHARAVLGVWLKYQGQMLGALSVIVPDQPRTFSPEELNLLSGIGSQVSTAIYNAQLFAQVKTGRERLQNLSKQLVDIQEAERRYLAKELHDEIGQLLTQTKMTLENIPPTGPEKMQITVKQAVGSLQQLIDQVRGLSLRLRPTILDDLGLLPAALWHIERFTKHTGIKVNFKYHPNIDRRFRQELETTAYRTLQESLTNIARYARVDQISVYLWSDEDQLGLQIEDHGAGFDVKKMLSSHESNGLSGMIERAQLSNGRLTIESAPGEGTLITLELPFEKDFLERRKYVH